MINEDFIPQAAAIPIRDGQMCLITSSNGTKWIIPKGMIDPGFSPPEAAAQEAWEEAGLKGIVHETCVGSFLYQKWGSSFEVSVFLMEVHEEYEDWPECYIRQRRWLPVDVAAEEITDRAMKEIVQSVLIEKDFGLGSKFR